MSKGINKAFVMGYVGGEVNANDKGTFFSIATNEQWKNKQTGNMEQRTEWHQVACFGPQAGVAKQYVKKGMLVHVEGSMRTNKYTDNNGVEKQSTSIICQNLTFAEKKGDNQQQGGYQGNNQNQGYGNQGQGSGQDYQRQSGGW